MKLAELTGSNEEMESLGNAQHIKSLVELPEATTIGIELSASKVDGMPSICSSLHTAQSSLLLHFV